MTYGESLNCLGLGQKTKKMADETDAGLFLRTNDDVIAYKRFMHDLSAHLTTKNIDELKFLVNLPGMLFSVV